MILSRRSFLSGALAGGVLLWADPIVGRTAKAYPRFTVPLPRPVELTGAAIELTAREADVAVLPGQATKMWTFNGTFPGPTIRRPSGERTTVTVRHELPNEVGSLTLHHHGGHQASEHDGHPGVGVIEPGDTRTYVYDLEDDGGEERAATQWYHDHSHLRTGRNSWMGLVGLFIVEDGSDAALGLPTGEHDVPLLIADRRFDADNQLVDPFTAPGREGRPAAESIGAGYPPGDEVVGDVFLVNGVREPYLDVAARRYRFRILNASNFRIYDIGLDDGTPLVQVATESGLMPEPVTRSSVLLGPGERAEVVVDFSGSAHRTLHLVSRESSDVVPRTAPTPATLLRFNVGAPVADPSTVPPVLRPLPTWVDQLTATPDRVWVFGLGLDSDGRPAWTINGQAFDHRRVDARPELGSTETWMFVNAGPVPMSHYVHIHDVDWYALSRNLAAPDPWEAALKETFRLDPGEVLLVGAKFTDHLGPFMIHCHMLEHEDHGMMATFEVVEPGAGDVPTAHRDAADPVAALLRDTLPAATAAAALSAHQGVATSGAPLPIAALQRPLAQIEGASLCTLDPTTTRS